MTPGKQFIVKIRLIRYKLRDLNNSEHVIFQTKFIIMLKISIAQNCHLFWLHCSFKNVFYTLVDISGLYDMYVYMYEYGWISNFRRRLNKLYVCKKMIFRFVSRLQNKSLYDHLLHWSIYVLLEKRWSNSSKVNIKFMISLNIVMVYLRH